MNDNKKYVLSNISSVQLNVMMDALDMYCRLGLLQFENTIPKDIQWNSKFGYLKNRDMINRHLAEVRSLIVEGLDNYKDMPRNREWSFGIGSEETQMSSKISYELYCDIRNFISISDGRIPRGKLNMTDMGDMKVEDMDVRLEKLATIINNIKKSQK